MAKTNGLTEKEIRQAKPGERPYNLYDTAGLYLTVAPTGAKWWRVKYRHAGRERRIRLGLKRLSYYSPSSSPFVLIVM